MNILRTASLESKFTGSYIKEYISLCVQRLQWSTMDVIFWEFLVLYKFFFPPQVKRSVIISNSHGIYEFPWRVAEQIKT